LCGEAGNTDPIWQVTCRSSEIGSREELYTPFQPLTLSDIKCQVVSVAKKNLSRYSDGFNDECAQAQRSV